MINLHWLELPMIFHGPKGVRAIEVRLYIRIIFSTGGSPYIHNCVDLFPEGALYEVQQTGSKEKAVSIGGNGDKSTK